MTGLSHSSLPSLSPFSPFPSLALWKYSGENGEFGGAHRGPGGGHAAIVSEEVQIRRDGGSKGF